ncbi:MAG: hypothetical protein ABSF26_09235 [Thermoguttaceae bacterium]
MQEFSFQLAIFLACLAAGPAAVWAASSAPGTGGTIRKTPGWQPPQPQAARAQVLAWLATTAADPAAKTKATALWAALPERATGSELLDRLAETCAVVDPAAAKLVALCSRPRAQLVLSDQAWLTAGQTPPLVANNLRFYYGRWLVLGSWFDEALEQLAGLKPADVVAPAELLFYQGVTHHRLLNKEQGLKAVGQLLDGAEQSPRRYVCVAALIQADLEALEPDTLDHVARRMEDIQRRLDLGRAGPKVRKVEDGVIDSLDKMIKKIQDQQKQSESQGGGATQSTKPAEASRPMGGRGPGEVAKKNIGNQSGWGDLPPKQREEALQHIGRDFPAHCRDIVEQYFRRLATEENSENK